jgi:hypothetical protein
MFNLSQAGGKRNCLSAPKASPRNVAMELLNQTHKEVPTGWVFALAELLDRVRRAPPRRAPLLLSGPRHAGGGLA